MLQQIARFESRCELLLSPDEILLRWHDIHAPKRKAPATPRRELIFARDGFACQYCGISLTRQKATIDHVIAASSFDHRSDAWTWENLTTSCGPCNWQKGSMTLKEWGKAPKIAPYKPSSKEMASYLNELYGTRSLDKAFPVSCLDTSPKLTSGSACQGSIPCSGTENTRVSHELVMRFEGRALEAKATNSAGHNAVNSSQERRDHPLLRVLLPNGNAGLASSSTPGIEQHSRDKSEALPARAYASGECHSLAALDNQVLVRPQAMLLTTKKGRK